MHQHPVRPVFVRLAKNTSLQAEPPVVRRRKPPRGRTYAPEKRETKSPLRRSTRSVVLRRRSYRKRWNGESKWNPFAPRAGNSVPRSVSSGDRRRAARGERPMGLRSSVSLAGESGRPAKARPVGEGGVRECVIDRHPAESGSEGG